MYVDVLEGQKIERKVRKENKNRRKSVPNRACFLFRRIETPATTRNFTSHHMPHCLLLIGYKVVNSAQCFAVNSTLQLKALRSKLHLICYSAIEIDR